MVLRVDGNGANNIPRPQKNVQKSNTFDDMLKMIGRNPEESRQELEKLCKKYNIELTPKNELTETTPKTQTIPQKANIPTIWIQTEEDIKRKEELNKFIKEHNVEFKLPHEK